MRPRLKIADEHEFEQQHGLPEALPATEKLLWQGAPEVRSLVRRVFHLPTLAAYFGLLLVVRVATSSAGGAGWRESLASAVPLFALAAMAIALLLGIAVLTARTTVYTITDRRIVMRIGIVLSVTFNLPFARIESAGLLRHADGSGDIPLVLAGSDRIAWLHLWPHARPWQVKRPEPALRCVPDAAAVARTLADAWSAARGIAAQPIVEPVAAPTAASPRERPVADLVGAR